eukprot:1266917-Alexandrium_andersonii.AAC.1
MRSASCCRTKTGQRERSTHGETRGRITTGAGAQLQPPARNFDHRSFDRAPVGEPQARNYNH